MPVAVTHLMRRIRLLLSSFVLVACGGPADDTGGDDTRGDDTVGDDTDDPGDDLWVIEREPGPWDNPEPPDCPEFAAPERELRLRGRQVAATPVIAAHYELISQTASVRVWGDQGTFVGDELDFTAEETWPLAAGGTKSLTIYYSDLAAPASGSAGGTVVVGLDDPNGPPDYECRRPLRIVSVRRE
jgi:hypothetical protein